MDLRQCSFPELGARYETVDVRTPWLRTLRTRSEGMLTDFAVLNRAVPFIDRMTERCSLTLVLSGSGRFDTRGRHVYLSPGDLVLSTASAGTEAYVGDALSVEWEPSLLGASLREAFTLTKLSPSDTKRMAVLAEQLAGDTRGDAIVALTDLLRANGLGIERVELGELTRDERGHLPLQKLQSAMSRRLSALHEFPSIDDVSGALGWDQRRVHRQMEQLRDTYRIVWRHWRELVHQSRMLRATQLLTAPGATTELVARLSGFRSPTALCHAFAKAGLPSPGRLSSIARSDAIGAWSKLAA